MNGSIYLFNIDQVSELTLSKENYLQTKKTMTLFTKLSLV